MSEIQEEEEEIWPTTTQKEVSMIPWETVCIDLVGPYTVTDKLGNDRTLLAITFEKDFLPLLHHHTTLRASPVKLVFGRDMLLDVKFIADWEAIRLRKQRDVDKNNNKKNSLRVPLPGW